MAIPSNGRGGPPAAGEVLDPFPSTADPSAYVALEASETALDALAAGLASGRRLIVLHGAPGHGKTLLLRVLAERLEDAAHLIYVPYGALEVDELCQIVLAELQTRGESTEPGESPEHALLAVAARLESRGLPLVVAIDDASALAPRNARRLVSLAKEGEGALRWIVVPIDDERADRVVAALGREALDVPFGDALSTLESQTLLDTCLERAQAPAALRDLFDGTTVGRLHAAAEGSPRRLLLLASRVARGYGAGDLGLPIDGDSEFRMEELETDEDEPLETDADPPLETDEVPPLETDKNPRPDFDAVEPPALEVDHDLAEQIQPDEIARLDALRPFEETGKQTPAAGVSPWLIPVGLALAAALQWIARCV